jgi:hypothetical protein
VTIQEYKNLLIKKVQENYQDHQILPCEGKKSLDEGFTFAGNKCLFWFNTDKDPSTKVEEILVNPHD